MKPKPSLILEAVASALRSFRWVALALFGLYLFSNTIVIQPGEVALVLRFGRLSGTMPEDQIHQPGLLFALPFPIDRILRVPVKEEGEVLIEDLWKSLSENSPSPDAIDPVKEGYCLTGDQNLLQARLVAKFRIDDPVAYALSVENPRGLIHDAVMSAVTQTIAGWQVDQALRLRDDQLQLNLATVVQQSAQRRLDRDQCGLALTALEFKEIHPPRHVKAEFERAQSARVEKETRKREALGFASSKIPQAEAERNRLVNEALANASYLRSKAAADVSIFQTLIDEHRLNPSATRERLHREALQQIMDQVGKRYFLPPRDDGNVRIVITETEESP